MLVDSKVICNLIIIVNNNIKALTYSPNKINTNLQHIIINNTNLNNMEVEEVEEDTIIINLINKNNNLPFTTQLSKTIIIINFID